MTDVLDQSEVDALLAAVATGDSGDSNGANAGKEVFSHWRSGRRSEDIEIRAYDFKRPERVSKDQMRALENLHEGFARNFGAALSGFLRTITDVKVASIEQMTFSEFTHALPNPTSFNILAMDCLDGNMCMEISPLIIYPVIDRLLGGSNVDLFIPQRPLTAIEQRLVQKIIDRGLASLEEAWASITPMKFSVEEVESNPQLVQIVPPNEVVVVIGFELKMGGRAGTMSLCIPYNAIEPIVEKLSNQTWAAYKRHRSDRALRERLAGHLDSAKLTVTALLADTTITLHDLMNLRVGDVILTQKPASSPLTLRVGNSRKYIGHLCQYKGNRAFKTQRPISPKDRV